MPVHDAPEILALDKARLVAREGIPAAWITSLRLAAGEIAFVEVVDPTRSGYLVDLCIGLDAPVEGNARFVGIDWQSLSPAEARRARRQIGLALWQGNWLPHMPVMDNIMLPSIHHQAMLPEALISEGAALARRFGLPGLPAARPEEVPPGELLRAACVKAFLGTPRLVIIEDPAVAAAADLHRPLAIELLRVQNRGGAAIVCVPSLGASVCGILDRCEWLRFGDRGLGLARRSHERLVGMAALHQ